MKMKFPISIVLLLAALVLAAPFNVSGKAKKSSTPDASATASPSESAAMKKPRPIPYHGTVASVDANAKSFMIGSRTIKVTDETKITRNGAAATMSDIAAGEYASGSYMKKDDGSMEATTVKIGKKKMKSTKASMSTDAQKKEEPSASASPKP